MKKIIQKSSKIVLKIIFPQLDTQNGYFLNCGVGYDYDSCHGLDWSLDCTPPLVPGCRQGCCLPVPDPPGPGGHEYLLLLQTGHHESDPERHLNKIHLEF